VAILAPLSLLGTLSEIFNANSVQGTYKSRFIPGNIKNKATRGEIVFSPKGRVLLTLLAALYRFPLKILGNAGGAALGSLYPVTGCSTLKVTEVSFLYEYF